MPAQPALRLCAALMIGLATLAGTIRPAHAIPPETLSSVVSVLPVWPGRAQGGTGGPPGVAPEGSGIVIEPDTIVTAWHVIEPAERIDVRLSDGRILPATLLAHDVASDIALLKVDARLTPIEVGPNPTLAQPVCAIGNAFGFGLSVTCGVVSALNISNAGFNPVEDFVQTDAASNPGNSGGALVDAEGRLVGMVSAIFASEADANIGMNFAVSNALLARVIFALLEDGDVSYPSPGWRLQVPGRRLLAISPAPVIAVLQSGGPAEAAGLQEGDRIFRIEDRLIRSPRDAIAALALLPENTESAEITFERQGELQTVRLPLEPAPARPESAQAETPLGDCPYPESVCLTRQAVFPISSFDPVGSATRISDTLLVTNRHVVGDRTDAVVYTPDGPRGATVVPSAYTGDLILLEVADLPEGSHIPELTSAALDADAFFAIGADVARQEVRVFDPGGLIAGPDPEANLGRIHVTARMQPGVSGGALVDQDGDLVGISVGGGDGRFEAIPLSDVQNLLDLREDGSAASTTDSLGEAFASCADFVSAAESAPPTPGMADACASANNHGQLLEAGRLLARAGDVDGAVALHGQAVEQVPNSINARISLLVSLQLGARFEDMTGHARWLVDMAPNDPQALRFAIQSGVWGGEPDLAEAGYEALLKADPRQAQAARRFIDNAPPRPPRR